MSAASTSALSAVLSALDNGSSGINVTSVVDSILTAESAPEQEWESQQSTLSSETTSIQALESDASSLTTALQSLQDVEGVFSSMSASSSSSAVSATAQTGAAAGSHSVIVNNLATTGSWYSDSEASATSALPAGSFSLTEGGTTTSFSTGSGSSDTLSDLAATINSAGIGVTASVITDSSGARLSLVSQASGAAGDFSVTAGSGLGFTQATVGKDASLTVDGVPIDSADNTVSGAIPGVILTLSAPSSTPVSVTVSPSTSSITSAVQSFVSAYNTLIGDLNTQFTFSSSTGTEGVLASDSAVRSMQTDVLAAANLTIGSGSYTSLASLGITTNDDGTLSLDTGTLDAALSSNYQGVVSFFQGSGSASGYATSLLNTLGNYTDASEGAFTVDLQSISNENQDLQNQINDFQTYLTTQQTLLTTEYNNANIALTQLPEQIKQTQTLLGEDSSGSS